jgi:putative methionine-R-sulfoxide reductase with GAF domain
MTQAKIETDRAHVVLKIGEDNRRYTKDLLTENENLRFLVASLRRERQELLEKVHLTGPLLDELAQLREEQARHRREQERVQQEISEIETRNKRFSEGYLEVERRNNDLMNLYVASYRLHGTVDRAEVLATIQEIVANLVGCEESGIFEVSPSGDELKLIASVGIDEKAFDTIKMGEGLIGQTAREGETFVAVDPVASNREGLTACIPLKLNGQVTGAIALFRLLPQKPVLQGVDHEMFDLLATHAATALYCTGLHAQQVQGGVC